MIDLADWLAIESAFGLLAIAEFLGSRGVICHLGGVWRRFASSLRVIPAISIAYLATTFGGHMQMWAARGILALIWISAAAGLQPARSAPVLISTVTDLGDGLFAYDLSIDAQDGEYRGYFAQDFTFTGNFAPFARNPDSEDVTASYLQEPWNGNRFGAPIQSPGSYSFHAGTGGGSKYLNVPLAHIVASGDLTVSGKIARDGLLYTLTGSLLASDPVTVLESMLDPSSITFPPETPALQPVVPDTGPPPSDGVDNGIRTMPMPVDGIEYVSPELGFQPVIPPSSPEIVPLIGEWVMGPPGDSPDEFYVQSFWFPGLDSASTLNIPQQLVPEPATWSLAATGLAALAIFGKWHGWRRAHI